MKMSDSPCQASVLRIMGQTHATTGSDLKN